MNKKSPFYRIIPKPVRNIIEENQTKKIIFDYYNQLPSYLINDEEKAAINYLKNNKLCAFPNKFKEQYNYKDIKVYNDDKLNLKYVLFDNKRLYFKRESSEKSIKKCYNNLLIEQDIKSPHRYLTGNFEINQNDILVDVGAAEGNLPLLVIEKIKTAYLFETDPNWIEALEATFAPWRDKIKIINKFVSDKNDDKHVSLDEFFKDNKDVNFLKIDAEGAESDILVGAKNILNVLAPLNVAVCCYHKPLDAEQLSKTMTEYGFKISFSDGYMFYDDPKTFSPPYLRKGLIRASKNN